MRDWREAFDKLLGPGKGRISESDLSEHVSSVGKWMTDLTPSDERSNPLTLG